MWSKTLSTCKDPADYAYCVCVVYSTGYSQPNRKQISVMRLESGIARADCSSMVSWVLHMGGFLPECPWFYTAIERDYLKEHNFTELECGIFEPKRNDVLWRPGHTALYIGEGLVAELIHDENNDAGWEGEEAGDQTGDESRLISYNPNEWDYMLRYNKQEVPSIQGVDEMIAIVQPNDDKRLVYIDGAFAHPLEHPDEAEALDMLYAATHNGAKIPRTKIGDKDAPWGTRLIDAINRKWS